MTRAQRQHPAHEAGQMLHLLDLPVSPFLPDEHVMISLADSEQMLQHPVHTRVVHRFQPLRVTRTSSFHGFALAALQPRLQQIFVETVAQRPQTERIPAGRVGNAVEVGLSPGFPRGRI